METNPITVLPNFTILGESFNPSYKEAFEFLLKIADKEDVSDKVHKFKITPKSVWYGCWLMEDRRFSIVETLKRYSKQDIPNNVVTEINEYINKYGHVTIMEDCLNITNKDLMEAVLCHPDLKQLIRKVEGNLVFLKECDFTVLSKIFEEELGYPITVYESKAATYLIEIRDNTSSYEYCYLIRDYNEISAFKRLYGVFKYFNEEDLKITLKTQKVTADTINEYMKLKHKEVYSQDFNMSYKVYIRTIPRRPVIGCALPFFGRKE